MKDRFWLFATMVSLLLLTANAKAATISGIVSGNKEKQIKIFYPFNGFTTVRFLLQNKSLVNLNSANQFSIHLTITHPTFIELYIDYNPVDLFVDNSSDLFVEIHLDSLKTGSHQNWLNIKGKYSKGNLYFNEYNFEPYAKYIGIEDFFSGVQNYRFAYLQRSIDSLVDRGLSPFDSLLRNNDIDRTFWNIVTKNIRSLLYLEIIRHPLASFDEKKKMPLHGINTLLTWLFNKCNPLDPELLFGESPTLYTKYVLQVKALQRENKHLYQQLSDSTIKIKNTQYIIHSFYKHLAEISDKRLQENLWAEDLFSYETVLKGVVTNNDIVVLNIIFPTVNGFPI